MKKSCFRLLAALSFAAIANPDSSFNKKKPKLGANGMRIVLEEAGKMLHPNFSKMMLISKKFNGAAESLTGQKAPFSFFELSSSLNFDFDKGETREAIKKFAHLKKLILSSSKGKKHLSFENLHAWAISDIAEILNHKPIQDTFESLTLNHFCSNTALQNALQNLKTLQSLSLTAPKLGDVNILEILNHKPIQDVLESLCLQELSLDPSLTSAFKNLKQLRSLSFRNVDFQNQHIELPLSLETLSIEGWCNAPDAFWHMLLSSNIKKFIFKHPSSNIKKFIFKLHSSNIKNNNYRNKNTYHLLDALEKWDRFLERTKLGLSKNIKILSLTNIRLNSFELLENLNQLEDLELINCQYSIGFLHSLSPDLHPHLKHLKICITANSRFFEYLPKFNQLETLFLSLEDSWNKGQDLTKLRFPESLKSLTFRGDAIWKDILFPESLTFLDLSNTYFRNTNLKFPHGVKHLDISNVKFENAEIEFPESLNSLIFSGYFYKTKIKWPNLITSLDISGYDFQNTDILFFKSLKSLNLDDCKFCSQDLSFSFALTELKIKDCQFLNTVIRFPESLKYLSFNHNPYQEHDCQNLEALQYCNQLETLVLSLGRHYKKEASFQKNNNIRFLTLPDLSTVAFLPDQLEKLVIERLDKEAFPPSSSLKSLKIAYVANHIKNLNLEKLTQLEKLQINGGDFRSLIAPSSLRSLKIDRIEYDIGDFNLDKLPHLESLDIKEMVCTTSSSMPILPSSLKSLRIDTIKSPQVNLNLENLVLIEKLHLRLTRTYGHKVSIENLFFPSSLKELRLGFWEGSKNFQFSEAFLSKISKLPNLKTLKLRIPPGANGFSFPLSLTFLKIERSGKDNVFWENLILPSSLEHLTICTDNKNFLQLLKLPNGLKEIIIDLRNNKNLRPFLSLPASLEYLEVPKRSITSTLMLPKNLKFINTGYLPYDLEKKLEALSIHKL